MSLSLISHFPIAGICFQIQTEKSDAFQYSGCLHFKIIKHPSNLNTDERLNDAEHATLATLKWSCKLYFELLILTTYNFGW